MDIVLTVAQDNAAASQRKGGGQRGGGWSPGHRRHVPPLHTPELPPECSGLRIRGSCIPNSANWASKSSF